MPRSLVVIVCVWGVLAGGASVAAQGQLYSGYATAQVGMATAGDLPESSRAVGVSVAIVDDSGWGAEMDVGYASHAESGRDRDIRTGMVSALWVSPKGLIRPYGVGGVGAMRIHGCLSGCPGVDAATDLALAAGGGAYVRVTDALGVRGDVRYLWAPGDHPGRLRPDSFGFWRVALGVTFQWTVLP